MTATIVDAVLALDRWIELSVLVKATVMLALGLTATRFATRAQASVRHLLLAATFGTLAALPLLVVTAPHVTIQVPVLDASRDTASIDAANAAARLSASAPQARQGATLESRPWTLPSWLTIARSAWIAGTTLLCLSLLSAVRRLYQMRQHGLPRPELRDLVHSLAREAGIRRSVDVLEHEDLLAPLTCGLWYPAILLPVAAREWDDADVERALIHELEHVRRGDWAVQLAARTVRAAYWFHPFAWMALRQLCLEAERACDDAVIRRSERADYANQLVLLARQLSARAVPAILGMAGRSDLSARVGALLDDRQRRGRAGAFAVASAIIAASLVAVAVAPVRAVAARPAEAEPTGEQRPLETKIRERRARAIDRALYEAAESGDLAEVDQLLQAGANVNAVVGGDGSPLIGAARSRRLALVRHLLDRGADVNMPVPGDGNPLIMAAHEGAVSVVELLLDRGANVDQIVPGDETALIQASGEGHLNVVELLVARGANINLGVWADQGHPRSRREWRSPLSMARKGGHESVVAFLLAAGAHE